MADMNITPASAALTPQQWDDKAFFEYTRKNRFDKYTGSTENAMIQVKRDLTKAPGDSLTFAHVGRLVGAGVTDNVLLEGNEEIMDTQGMKLAVRVIRHAVAMSNWDEQRSAIDLRNAARTLLLNWEVEKMRADTIGAFSQVAPGVTYAAANATQRNAWLVANSDRVLFGSARANAASGVMATALATLDNTQDKMTGAVLSLAKRMAQTASPHIRPASTKDANDEEWFIAFMPSLVFRDFRNDPAVLAANKDARDRGTDNPLFTGGDLLWDGMIVREIPELPVLTGAGTAGIDVAATYLCGAQALGMAWAQTLKSTTNKRDYDFMYGVGIQEIRGIGKLQFGRGLADTTHLVDNGMATIFTAATGDA